MKQSIGEHPPPSETQDTGTQRGEASVDDKRRDAAAEDRACTVSLPEERLEIAEEVVQRHDAPGGGSLEAKDPELVCVDMDNLDNKERCDATPCCPPPPPLTRSDCYLHDYLLAGSVCRCLTSGALRTILGTVRGMTVDELYKYDHRPVRVTAENNVYTIVLEDQNGESLTHVINTPEYNNVLQRYLN